MTIREETGFDGILLVKQSFVDRFSKLYPTLSLKVGDKLFRQPNVENGDVKILIRTSSMIKTDMVGQTCWKLEGINDVCFYINYMTEVSFLLKRTFHIDRILSTDTELLHECFFLISLADLVDSNGNSDRILNINDIDTLDIFIDSLKTDIKNKNDIKMLLRTKITNSMDVEVIIRKNDAYKCAVSAYKTLLQKYVGLPFVWIERVTETCAGRKKIADIVVKMGENIVSLSLKYGNGQLNNLNVSDTLKLLYGIEFQGNFFDTIYLNYKSEIDDLLRYYVSQINILNPPTDNSQRINDDVTYDIFKKLNNKHYLLSYTLIKEKFNTDERCKKFVCEFQKLKQLKISRNISNFIEINKKSVDTKTEFLSYILRSEDENSYIYIGDCGNTVYMVPSKSTLCNMKPSIEIVEKLNCVDYSTLVKVSSEDREVMTFDMNIRWCRTHWSGDMSLLSRNLQINK